MRYLGHLEKSQFKNAKKLKMTHQKCDIVADTQGMRF